MAKFSGFSSSDKLFSVGSNSRISTDDKMNMTLDDLINKSKVKGGNQRGPKNQRNGNVAKSGHNSRQNPRLQEPPFRRNNGQHKQANKPEAFAQPFGNLRKQALAASVTRRAKLLRQQKADRMRGVSYTTDQNVRNRKPVSSGPAQASGNRRILKIVSSGRNLPATNQRNASTVAKRKALSQVVQALGMRGGRGEPKSHPIRNRTTVRAAPAPAPIARNAPAQSSSLRISIVNDFTGSSKPSNRGAPIRINRNPVKNVTQERQANRMVAIQRAAAAGKQRQAQVVAQRRGISLDDRPVSAPNLRNERQASATVTSRQSFGSLNERFASIAPTKQASAGPPTVRYRTQTAGVKTQTAGLRTQTAGLRTQTAGLRTQTAGPRTQNAGPRTTSRTEGTVVRTSTGLIRATVPARQTIPQGVRRIVRPGPIRQ